MAYTFRVTGLPWFDSDSDGERLMHLGGAFSQRFPQNDKVTINSGPQNSLLTVSDNPGSPFVPVITIPANQYQLYNLEWALLLGSLCLQAEWTGTSIEQLNGGPIFLNGCYGSASYFLTGEHRQYVRKDGSFGVTHVLAPFIGRSGKSVCVQGTGAWELVGRRGVHQLRESQFAADIVGPTAGRSRN